jgi:hypothetical protein
MLMPGTAVRMQGAYVPTWKVNWQWCKIVVYGHGVLCVKLGVDWSC